MPSLKELLGTEPKRSTVIQDACQVLDLEVGDKSGLSGIAIKGAYSVVKGIRPGFVRDVVDALLDEFLDGLEPLYREALERNVPPGPHIEANKSRVAAALLAVTDGKAERAERAIIKKTYEKLRPTAQKHVEAAAPRLAQLLERHAS